ncbi:hypothetical protein BGY98DRAFT_705543 [Russula aff. rugulosa BPL654]|nr:hypothetical protein BGY98DRAFT_705543 [Russula aff. rugulosa BPL654]
MGPRGWGVRSLRCLTGVIVQVRVAQRPLHLHVSSSRSAVLHKRPSRISRSNILATLPILGTNAISLREAAPSTSSSLSSSHTSRTTVLSRCVIGRSSFAQVSCAQHTHRRSASVSWPSRPTTASCRVISHRHPYVSLASCSVASSRTSCRTGASHWQVQPVQKRAAQRATMCIFLNVYGLCSAWCIGSVGKKCAQTSQVM